MADQEDIFTFTVTSPLGHEVFLRERTLMNHVIGDHKASRDMFLNKDNLSKIAQVMENPTFIVDDKNHSTRQNYFDMTTLTISGDLKAMSVKVVTETLPNTQEMKEDIVTMFVTTKGIDDFKGRRVQYDRHNSRQESDWRED